jgi:putative endonuclease
MMEPSYTVYIVECADGSLYTGITTDVVRRVGEHNGEGGRGARATRARRPVVLRYTETCATRSDALKREYAIKQLAREEKLALCTDH